MGFVAADSDDDLGVGSRNQGQTGGEIGNECY